MTELPNREPLAAEIVEAARRCADIDPNGRGPEYWMVQIQGFKATQTLFMDYAKDLIEAFKQLSDVVHQAIGPVFDDILKVMEDINNPYIPIYCPRHGNEMKGGFCRKCSRPPRHMMPR